MNLGSIEGLLSNNFAGSLEYKRVNMYELSTLPDDDGLLRAGLVTEDFFSFAADCLRVVTMMIILAGRVRVCVYEANRLKHNVSL